MAEPKFKIGDRVSYIDEIVMLGHGKYEFVVTRVMLFDLQYYYDLETPDYSSHYVNESFLIAANDPQTL